MKTGLLSPGALLLALAIALPAQAGLFDDEQARAGVDQLRRDLAPRLDKLEAAQRGQIELANQIEEMRQETARLRGQIEVLTHELGQLQKRQQDLYVDVDNRVRRLEAGPPHPEATTTPPPGAGAVVEPPAEAVVKRTPQTEARDYEAALGLFKAGRYKEAGGAFESFIRGYPASGFQANAHYWLGNSLYQQRDYRRAKDVFLKIPVSWPDDPKAADALLGVSNCQMDGGDMKGSRATLENLVAHYPSSTAAQIARQRLGKKN
jgi:tol-pal system protein YbgF